MQHLLLMIAIGIALALQASSDPSSVEDFIQSELKSSGLPGVSYAFIENGAVLSNAHGVTDLRTGRAVEPDTPFQIASISKSFTAVAILQLVETGDVELDGELSQYLGLFRGSPAEAITIRQLLSHTSGYSTRQGNETYVDDPGSEDALYRQIERIASWSPAYPPNTQWDYSNANYVLLGGVIEAVSGLDFDQYVETNILVPVGMKNSFVGDGGAYQNVAAGHTPWFGGKRPVGDLETKTARASAPGGGVIASANDLALYLSMLLNEQDDIISAEHKRLMMQPANEKAAFYGLGWMLNPQNGTVYHTGTNPGVETIAIMLPNERKGVVVLVNAGSGMGFGETSNLINGIIAKGFGWDFVRNQSSWGRKSLFLMFALLPLLFVAGTIQAWLQRAGLKTKTGTFGTFSLWFPLLMTSALAWVSVSLIPGLFGVSLSTLHIFSPDLAFVLGATALSGIIWAIARLCIFYVAKPPTP